MKLRLALTAACLSLTAAAVTAQDVIVERAPPPPPGYVPGGGPPNPTIPQALPPEESAPAPPPPFTQAQVAPVEAPPKPKAPAKPMTRPRFTAAVLQAVDKVTAETLRFEAKVGEPLRYKGLLMTVHACENTAPDEGFSDSLAHLEIQTEPETYAGRAPSRVIYRGWMSENSPGLHPLEHPSYDLWLIACKTAAPSA
jgi:hypothetical protein